MTIEQRLSSTSTFFQGEVAFIGAGPGDPELLTIKAFRFISQAEVVIFDRLVSAEIMALLPKDCHKVYVGKSTNKHSMCQDKINEALVYWAQQNKRVVRLKGGDNFIFGRGSEEINYLLKSDIASHVIPGITAASGCTSYAGIPLTHRNVAHSCSFITGHFSANGDLQIPWQNYSDPGQTLVFYMGVKSSEQICSGLINHGRKADTPVAIIHKGTQSQQKVWRSTLAKLPDMINTLNIKPPSLLVIGDVVNVINSQVDSTPAYITPFNDVLQQITA